VASVEIRAIGKSFGATPVLDGVDLDVADGEFVVLLGPSGCGKSTLLRLVAGLEEATSGSILIGGMSADALPPQQRNIAMVFQSYALFPHMTARQNIAYGPKLRGEAAAAVGRKVEEASGVLNLLAMLDRLPKQLSGGQRQRIAMGRALVRAPDVFLFDEPLSNLDASLRVKMRGEIKALQRRMGVTAIYVTHDQIEAMTMADRIVVMNRGRIEQQGAPLEVYDRPATRFVAEFIGSPAMNLIEGHAYAAAMKGAGFESGLPADASGLTIGIRPEKLALSERGLPFRIDLVEPTGAETLIHGKLGAAAITAAIRGRIGARQGETVRLAHHPDDRHIFRADGARLG
jgi:multiple sugar transport system ATP-binding protein